MQIRMAYALVVLLLGLLLVGYALPAPGAAAETPTPAAEVAATPPPEVLTVQVTGTVVNLRAGPGLAHEVQAQVQQGDELQVTGIHTDQAWLQVARAGPSLWISADLTDMAAERRHALPVVSATTVKGPTPTPTGGLVVGSTATPTPTLQPPQAAESPGAPPAEAELKGLPVTVTGAVVNVRAGPSRQHDVVSQVPQGTELPVTGISEDRQWLHTAPDGESRWIYADLTDMEAAVRQELVVVPVPPLTIEGAYDNRAAHWEGTYTLEQWSSTIGAVFSTTRSLVPAFAPPDPEILFTVPAGFRPALEIEWEIEGWPVSDEGVIEDSQSAPRLITVRVSTDGAVHYRDPAQVEGIEYVRYTARLAWPRAGTAPKVCERYFSIKRALVAILKMGDEDSPAACAGITWAQLATIKDLSDLSRYEGDLGYVAVRRAADLAGLQGLTTTKIWNIGSWPAGVLVPVPQLEILHILSGSRYMDGPYSPPSATALPEDLLQYTPHLKDLRLEVVSMEKFRDGFLASVPRLRTLHIKDRLPTFYHPLVWPDHIRLDMLLAPIPDLTELYLDLGTHTEIPPQMLASVPGLKTLTLVVPRTMAMPDHFPAGVPQLRHLTVLFSVAVQFPHLSVLPETFLTAVPQLESLSLGLGQMQYLPASFLAETPRLRQIRLGLLLKDPMEWLLLYERLAQLNEDWLFDPAFRLGHYNQVSVGRQQICATWGSRLTCWPGPGSPYTLARRYKAVAAGDSHTCGLTQDHRIECWDQNGFRHLETPAEEFQSVAVGLAHSCGVRTDSKVVCWGNNGHGQTDVPAGSYQAVAAGHTHSCGLRTDGTLVCWGDNRQGQSDPPTGEFREVTAGGHFSCALSRRARQVRCWGDNGVGQTDVPDNILKFRAHVESIDAGFDHACAVVAEVGIVCWGSNEFGQREGPSGNFGSVSAGYQASCALTSGGTRLCWGWPGRPVVQATGNAGTRPRGLAATGAPLVTYRVVAGKPVPISPVQGPSACPEQGPSPSLACDRELLLAIQESLELWVQPGREARRLWPAYVPAQDYEGVTVSGDPPRVSSVSLRLSSGLLDMPAHGTLPAALGRLSHLQHLDLSNNELTGPLPPELGQLAQLQVLGLIGNQLTGPLPPELGQLARLESLNLARNQLTGALPPELGQLTQLVELYLQGNRLTGPLPPTLGQLTQLRRLWLSGNQLTGSLPSALGQLTVLVELNLAYNQVTGAIPPELGQLSSLERLDLYHNQLTGAIPPELGQLSDLPQLTLTHNQLTGAIPLDKGIPHNSAVK